MEATYSPLGQYPGHTVYIRPLAKSDTCASERGLLDMFLTHWALDLSGAGVDGVAAVVNVVVALTLGVELFVGEEFGQSLSFLYIYLYLSVIAALVFREDL